MKKEKKIIWLLTGIAAVSLLVLCTVVIVRTATYPFIRTTGPDGPPRSVEPSAQAVERLAGGIRIPTVSDAIDRTDDNPFQAFKAYLPQAYPAIYSQLDTLTINEYGLVFRWPGKKIQIPWFIFWFVVAMLVNTYCNLPTQLTHGISVAARCGLSATLFLIGGGLSIEVIRKVGLKPLVLGIILWAVISVASLAVILLL